MGDKFRRGLEKGCLDNTWRSWQPYLLERLIGELPAESDFRTSIVEELERRKPRQAELLTRMTGAYTRLLDAADPAIGQAAVAADVSWEKGTALIALLALRLESFEEMLCRHLEQHGPGPIR